MSQAAFTKDEILSQLDRAGRWYTSFLTFRQGQVYPIDTRLSAFADGTNWTITIEVLIFSPHAEGHNGVITWLFSYGNCMRIKVPAIGPHVFRFSSDGPEGPTFVIEGGRRWEHVRPGVRSIRIRGNVVPIETDPAAYEEMGIELLDPPRIKGHELLRALPRRHRNELLLTDEERRIKFKKSARPPMLLQLDEWYHPDAMMDELPSKCETFQLIADVLTTGDPHKYAPRRLPNTHWSNWPDAGMLERPIE